MGLGGNPSDPFPSWLSLYLAGLGIKHIFIRSHRPTDQPQIDAITAPWMGSPAIPKAARI